MEFISIVNYENGNYSTVIFPEEDYKISAEILLEEFEAYKDITDIWVLPYDADEYPDGNANMAGEYFSITRTGQESRRQK